MTKKLRLKPVKAPIPNTHWLLFLVQIDSERTDMVVCVLSNNRKDRYDTIKKFVCIEKPVPSQMVIGKTISMPDLLTAVATKISIQINCKLGGKDTSVMANGHVWSEVFQTFCDELSSFKILTSMNSS